MESKYARVKATFDLRGHIFPAGTLVKVWDAGDIVSIQPTSVPTRFHKALWYILTKSHHTDLDYLSENEASLVDFDLIH